MKEEIAKQIKKHMKGMTNVELAERLGVSRSYVTHLLKGENLTIESLERLCIALKVRLSILLEDE